MSDSMPNFQAEVAAVLEALMSVAVVEITKLFEGRSFVSPDSIRNADAPHKSLLSQSDLKANMQNALRNSKHSLVCSVGVQAGDPVPVEQMAGAQQWYCPEGGGGSLQASGGMEEAFQAAFSTSMEVLEAMDVQCSVGMPFSVCKHKEVHEDGVASCSQETARRVAPQEDLSSGLKQEPNGLCMSAQIPAEMAEAAPPHTSPTKPQSADALPGSLCPADRSLCPADRSLCPADRSLRPADRSLCPADRSLCPADRSLRPAKCLKPSEVSADLLVPEPAGNGGPGDAGAIRTERVSDPTPPARVQKMRGLLSQTRPCSVRLVNLLLMSRVGAQTHRSQRAHPALKDLRTHHPGLHTGRRLCCFRNCGNGVWRLQCAGPAVQRSHACVTCGKKFKRRKILRRHERFHTGEKPYACPRCHKTFALRKSLRRHQRFHTGERPHSCAACGKGFRLKHNLKAHLRFHTGEKPYACTFCPKSFRIHKNLEKHKLSHSGTGTFPAEVAYGCIDVS